MNQQDWTRDWLPAPHQLNTRYEEPGILESAAVAAAASQFATAVTRMAQEARAGTGEDKTGEDETGEDETGPRDEAMNLAISAAVVEHQVSTIEAYIQLEEILDPEEGEEDEEDDPPPEALQAKEQIKRARATADALSQLARTGLEELGIPVIRKETAPSWEERDIEEKNREYRAHRLQADAAATIGNAAAINWLLDRLVEDENQDEHDHERMGALVLAMWPNEQYLVTGKGPELPPEAAMAREDTIRRVMDMIWNIEEHRPVFLSELTQDEWENDGVQYLLSNLNAGPETDPAFEWDAEKPEEAVMAYRHQGSTHVKRVREQYDHPIEIREALHHCNELEDLIIDLHDEDEPEGAETQAHRCLLKMAAVGRAMALINIHDGDWDRNEHAIRIAMEHGGPTRAQELIRAIYDDQAEAVNDAMARHALLDPPLREGELRAAMEAARAAGAADEALRQTASMLGVTREGTERLGIPERKPIPWEKARAIIMHLCATIPPVTQERWERIAAATGWSTDSPEVRELREITKSRE